MGGDGRFAGGGSGCRSRGTRRRRRGEGAGGRRRSGLSQCAVSWLYTHFAASSRFRGRRARVRVRRPRWTRSGWPGPRGGTRAVRRVRHGPGQFGAWPWLDRETLAGAGGRAGQGERAAAAGAQPDTGTWTWGGQLRRTHTHAHTVLQPRALALGDTRPHRNIADSLALALGCPTAEHARVLLRSSRRTPKNREGPLALAHGARTASVRATRRRVQSSRLSMRAGRGLSSFRGRCPAADICQPIPTLRLPRCGARLSRSSEVSGSASDLACITTRRSRGCPYSFAIRGAPSSIAFNKPGSADFAAAGQRSASEASSHR